MNKLWYRDARHECDFVVCDGRKGVAAYQVSYDISNPKARKREIEGAAAAAKAMRLKKAYVLTYSESDVVRYSSGIDVEIVPVAEWLVAYPPLEG